MPVQEVARRRLAVGGIPGEAQGGWWQKNKTDPVIQHGLIPHPTPGRADAHNFSVPTDTYILPADVVSAGGEGNTANGAAKLNRFSAQVAQAPGFQPQLTQKRPMVPVKLSGGEYAMSPSHVAQIGHGNVDYGHDVLDAFVKKTRADHIKTLKKLPGPVR